MAFGDRIKKFGEKLGKIDPFAGRLLGGDSKDRKKFEPQAQYFGGTKEQAEAYRKRFATGADAAGQQITGAQGRIGEQYDRANALSKSNAYDANEARVGFHQNLGNYQNGRQAILNNAGQLEQQAAMLPSTYQQTADRQFALNQARNQSAAASLGSMGGAAGLRSALASSSNANADAAAQAEIARANEFNQLQQMQQGALTNAANIRSGVGAQDQSAAGLESGRNLAFAGNALNANAQAGNLATAQGQLGLGAQGQFLGAMQGAEGSQLEANKKAEDQRQLYERQQFNKKWHPVMSAFNQA